MLGKRQTLKIGVMGAAMTLLATPAFARSVELRGAGATLWVFIILGVIIVLLQLIPAAVLFFSFVGTTTAALKEEKRAGQAILSEIEPVAVKK